MGIHIWNNPCIQANKQFLKISIFCIYCIWLKNIYGRLWQVRHKVILEHGCVYLKDHFYMSPVVCSLRVEAADTVVMFILEKHNVRMLIYIWKNAKWTVKNIVVCVWNGMRTQAFDGVVMYTVRHATVCVMCILSDTGSMAIMTGQISRLHTGGCEAQAFGVGLELVLWAPDESLPDSDHPRCGLSPSSHPRVVRSRRSKVKSFFRTKAI